MAATRDGLAVAVQAIEAALRPADPLEFSAVMMAMLGELAAFGCAMPDRKIALGVYRRALADLPADLLQIACRRMVDRRVWRNLPMAEEITAAVADAWAQRKIDRDRHELALTIVSRRRVASVPRLALAASITPRPRPMPDPVLVGPDDVEASLRRMRAMHGDAAVDELLRLQANA